MTNSTSTPTNDIPPSILALVFHPTHSVGEPRHQDVLRHALAISTLLGEPVRVLISNLTFRVEVTPYGTVALVHPTGDPVSKSIRRWTERFAQRMTGLPKVKKGAASRKVPDPEDVQRSARLTTPRTGTEY